MSTGWENYKSSPVEYMHEQLLKEFHKFRLSKTGDISILMNGSKLNDIIVEAKKNVYEIFEELELDKPVKLKDN